MNVTAALFPDLAGDHMVRRIAVARSGETAREVLAGLAGHAFDCLENVHVLDAAGRLAGLVPLTRLVAASGPERLDTLMDSEPLTVAPDLSQERVVALARRHHTPAPPVVDAAGRLLGCVPPAALIEIGRREHSEDISRLAGILHGEHSGRHALEMSPARRALRRLPWLLVGLAGSAVATALVVQFEDQLASRIAVAFFIPAIVYLADAVGTQTEAVVVRGLSFNNAPSFRQLLAGELATGIIIGAALGAVAMPLVYLGFGDLPLALAVASSIAIAGAMAAVCGLVFPWLLARAGLDPAFGSGPVATVIQDVVSLLVYFSVVQWLLAV